jgi:endonuclease/exonuclease/phosphatase family metal-dependent hydrolase
MRAQVLRGGNGIFRHRHKKPRTSEMVNVAERTKRVMRRRTKRPPSVASEAPRAGGAAVRELVVATYNIHACIGVDRRYDPVRVAAVLRELDADIIGLQEVAARRHGPVPLDQESFLAAATELRAVSGLHLIGSRSRFGNAILTRLPILAVRHIDLSVDGRAPRTAIDVDLEVDGRVLRVLATHFGLHGGERLLQARKLLAALNGADRGPRADAVLMMGDLNEWRGRQGGIRVLDRALGRAPAPRTFPSWCPILPLDRIYAALPAVLHDFDVHRSPLARLASDHLPLRARLAWRTAV